MSLPRRNLVPIGLGLIAIVVLLTALVVRPRPLPSGSAIFGTALITPLTAAVPGRTFAIDWLVTGDQRSPVSSPLMMASGPPIMVIGWVLDPRTSTPVNHLIVRDDHTVSPPIFRCHEPRPDVASVLGVPAAVASGFQAIIQTKALTAGSHTFSVDAIANDGRIFVLPTPIKVVISPSHSAKIPS